MSSFTLGYVCYFSRILLPLTYPSTEIFTYQISLNINCILQCAHELICLFSSLIKTDYQTPQDIVCTWKTSFQVQGHGTYSGSSISSHGSHISGYLKLGGSPQARILLCCSRVARSRSLTSRIHFHLLEKSHLRSKTSRSSKTFVSAKYGSVCIRGTTSDIRFFFFQLFL